MTKQPNKNFKFKFKAGDQVKVLRGDGAGHIGKVVRINRAKMRVEVEGYPKKVKVHTKPNRANPDGGIIEKVFAVHYSNIMRVDSGKEVTRQWKKD